MSKYCGNCGTEVSDDAIFCANCGCQFQIAPAPVIEEKKKNKLVGIIAVGVAAVIAIVAIFGIGGLLFGDRYEEVACKFAAAEVESDLITAKKYIPYDLDDLLNNYLEAMAKMYDKSVDEIYELLSEEEDIKVKSLKDIYKYAKSEQTEDLKEDYGKYKIKTEVLDTDKYSKDDLEDLIDELKDTDSSLGIDMDDFINPDKITAAYEVEVEITIDGKEDSETKTKTYDVVKYKGKWKVLDTDMLDIF